MADFNVTLTKKQRMFVDTTTNGVNEVFFGGAAGGGGEQTDFDIEFTIEYEDDWEIPYNPNCNINPYTHEFSTKADEGSSISNDSHSNLDKTFYAGYLDFYYSSTYKILRVDSKSVQCNSSFILESGSSQPTANDTYYYDGEEITNIANYFPYVSYIMYSTGQGELYVKPVGMIIDNGVPDFIFADATHSSSPGE